MIEVSNEGDGHIPENGYIRQRRRVFEYDSQGASAGFFLTQPWGGRFDTGYVGTFTSPTQCAKQLNVSSAARCVISLCLQLYAPLFIWEPQLQTNENVTQKEEQFTYGNILCD